MNTNINPSPYQTTKNLYREVIRQTLVEYNVTSLHMMTVSTVVEPVN